MVDPDDRSVDDELRRRASRARDAVTAAVDVDADLEAVSGRVGAPVVAADVGRPVDQRLVWLSAAALVALVAGVVAVVAARDDGETIRSAGTTRSSIVFATTTTSLPTSSAPAPVTTAPPAAVTTSTMPPSTSTTPPTTIADEAAPPPATTLVPVAATTTTTVAGTVESAPDECWNDPTPPPSLADGSPVGEPVVTDADKGLGTTTYTWGVGAASVSQVVGTSPAFVQTWERPGQFLGGVWTSIVLQELPGGPFSVQMSNLATGCEIVYTWSADVADRRAVEAVARDWVRIRGADSTLPSDRSPAIAPDVPYFSTRITQSLDGTEEPLTSYLRFDDGGARLTALTDDEIGLAAEYPIDLGDGRRVGLVSGRQWEPCPGEQPTAVGEDGAISVDQRVLADPVSSIAGSAAGWVVVTRGVCPEGTFWGQPGTAIELVRHHVGDPDVEPLVVGRIEPEPNEPVVSTFRRGRWQARTVDGSGRYAGVWEATSVETGTFHLIDMLATDGSTTTPLELPSGCGVATEIVAPPRFVDDGVVIARACADGTVAVDVISLFDRSLAWSQTIDGPTPLTDSGSIGGLSAIVAEGETWVLATFDVVPASEEPYARASEVTRTVVLNSAAQSELPAIGGVNGYAFTIEDLATNR